MQKNKNASIPQKGDPTQSPKHPHLIELQWRGDPPPVHCLVCGKEISSDGAVDACPHLLLYHSDLGGYAYVHPRLNTTIEDVEERFEDPFDLIKQLDSDRAVFLEISTSGVACGPVSLTAFVGFEFPVEQEEHEHTEEEGDRS